MVFSMCMSGVCHASREAARCGKSALHTHTHTKRLISPSWFHRKPVISGDLQAFWPPAPKLCKWVSIFPQMGENSQEKWRKFPRNGVNQ